MWATPDDWYPSPTSIEQRHTEEAIHALFEPYVGTDARPLPTLRAHEHIAYLHRLLEPLPAPYITFDANRAWLVYWVAHALDLLGQPLQGTNQARAISTLLHFQAPTGGFGGGPGQIGHLMSTYAAVCALAIVGGPGAMPSAEDIAAGHSVDVGRGGWDAIDREAIYAWMMRLKQPDGSFLVHEHGEIDVRASYCVLVIAMLLGIATEELIDGMGSFIASCQTYEGGFAAQSAATYQSDGARLVPSVSVSHQVPQGEAHGGYAFCALAAHTHLSLLGARYAEPIAMRPLLRWATSLQGTAMEGGGFRGRTNKLVDGCYGWFCGGGLMTALEALVAQESSFHSPAPAPVVSSPASDASWQTVSDSAGGLELLDRDALRAYILVAAQVPRTGGLRDKPGKRPDAYHTCYNLSGLSLCEHRLLPHAEAAQTALRAYDTLRSASQHNDFQRQCYATCLAWQGALDEALVAPTHPIFNISLPHVARMVSFMYA